MIFVAAASSINGEKVRMANGISDTPLGDNDEEDNYGVGFPGADSETRTEKLK